MSEQRLINANALEQNLISKGFYPAMVKRAIEIAPTIEAEPVRHGKWIDLEPTIGLFSCTECEHKILRAKCNYCPRCGARMDGDVT